MTSRLCKQLGLCAKYGCMCCYAPRGVEVCVGMKQVEVRVIIVQCLEQDFILDGHYNTVTLLLLLLPVCARWTWYRAPGRLMTEVSWRTWINPIVSHTRLMAVITSRTQLTVC